jgi:hypothetical protein
LLDYFEDGSNNGVGGAMKVELKELVNDKIFVVSIQCLMRQRDMIS